MATSTPQRQNRTVRRAHIAPDYSYRRGHAAATRARYGSQTAYAPQRRTQSVPSPDPGVVRTPKTAAQPKKTEGVRVSKKKALQMLGRIGIVFVMCYLMIYRYTLILESNDKITKLGSDLAAAEYQNQSIQAKIDRALELGTLEEYATGRLGMIRPDQSQIFYVDVQMGDETTAKEEDKPNTLSGTPGALIHAIRVLK